MRTLETIAKMTNPSPLPEDCSSEVSASPRKAFFSTSSGAGESLELVADNGASQVQDSALPWFGINWEIKALVPIACVLLGGMLLGGLLPIGGGLGALALAPRLRPRS